MKEKKTCTNGEIFTIAQILFGGNGNEGILNKKHLKTRMAVRHALKFNTSSIQDANKAIGEMIQEIITELMDDFVAQDKATKDDNGYQVKDEFQNEFLLAQQEKLNELSAQTVELDLYMIPESEYEAYGTQNDGELTDAELDVLEFFVKEPEEEKETEE